VETEVPDYMHRYLGKPKPVVKQEKPSDKFKKIFQQEWDDTDDTTLRSDAIYSDQIVPLPLRGRGLKAKDELSSRKLDSIELQRTSRRWTDKRLEEMTERDWRIFREDYEINVKGGRTPLPIRSWRESKLQESLLRAVEDAGYRTPLAVQMQSIPIGLAMRDLVALAPPGTGKSAAYLLPLLSRMIGLPALDSDLAPDGPYALILAPTRELAIQITQEAKKLGLYTRVRISTIVGGRDFETQASEIRRGVEVVIGTPGRIKDCLERQALVFNQCAYVVVDEADKMVLLGLEADLAFIIGAIPPENLKSLDEVEVARQELQCQTGDATYRVTQLFSATMDSEIEKLWRSCLRAPAYISIGEAGANLSNIRQKVYFLHDSQKRHKLTEVLRHSKPPMIVFVNHKKTADDLSNYLSQLQWRVGCLHGGKTQVARESTMEAFKAKKFSVLVATDLAARGIDVKDLQHVVNYDCPTTITEYEHRIGRTGRVSTHGLASTFVVPGDEEILHDLKIFLEATKQHVPSELARHSAVQAKAVLE
jgi:ATP-dependent RNA helicase DDX23/PRP28